MRAAGRVFGRGVVIDELQTAAGLMHSVGVMLFHLLRQETDMGLWLALVAEFINALLVEAFADLLDILFRALIG